MFKCKCMILSEETRAKGCIDMMPRCAKTSDGSVPGALQDIKSPNVLLGADFTAKLADVGLAKLQHKDYLSAHQAVGTFTWSAPEVLMGDRCTEKVDQFSFGVVLWELVTGETPARGRLRPVKCAPRRPFPPLFLPPYTQHVPLSRRVDPKAGSSIRVVVCRSCA